MHKFPWGLALFSIALSLSIGGLVVWHGHSLLAGTQLCVHLDFVTCNVPPP